MNRHDIPVNDLHAVIGKDIGRYLDADYVHLTVAGQMACAEAVVNAVTPWFGKARATGTATR